MITEYFIWHYSKGLKNVFLIMRNFVKFFWKFFSIKILFRTLFSPWRKDITFSNWRGLHPLLFLQKLFNNLFSRVMGSIARSVVILLGLSIEAITLTLVPVILISWIILPAFLLSSFFVFSNLLFRNDSYGLLAVVSSAIFFLSSLFLSAIAISAFVDYKRYVQSDSEEKNLQELSQERWFLRIWNRMGFSGEEARIKTLFANKKALEKELQNSGLSLESFNEIITWEKGSEIKKRKKRKFWTEENLAAVTPIGKYWHFGYTVELDKYALNLPRGADRFKYSYMMGRNKEIELAEIILSRPSQNSFLLIGEPGVGKKTLINLLAKKIKEEKTNPALKYKRLVEIQLDQVISEYNGNELMIELNKIFVQAAFAGNVILFIDNIHEFISGEGKLKVDISPILFDYLAIPTFQLIGTTTSQDFHVSLEKKTSLMKYVDKIILEELSGKETKLAMLNFLEKEEQKRILVTYQAIEEIVKLADQYITDTPMPEKALDILEEVLVSWGQNSSNFFVLKEDVDKVFSEKTKIPLGEIGATEQKKLMNLEAILKKRVIGQDEIIKQISQVMLRARSGISDRSKPIGSFLFLGGTGVGKTETAKALAEAYFGHEDKMIRLDMSEYQSADSVERILGQEKLGTHSKFLAEVSEKPFSVLLLDEIEKAYPEILNLFLQILDEGWLTDAFGKKIIFKNMIIIATSNAGAEIIKDGIESGYSNETIHKQVIDYAISSRIFRPEFLNRFENVLFFKSLEGDELTDVANLILKNMAARIYKNKNIKINFGEDLILKIIEKGYDPIFGARSIKHFVQDKIEDILAKKIVEGNVSEGEEIELKAEDMD